MMSEKKPNLDSQLPAEKEKDQTEDVKIKVNHSASSLAEFTKRKLPDEKELKEFEEFIEEEAREEEIEESLNEIYRDGKGEIVDVHRLDIKKKRGFLFWFFSLLFFFSASAALLIFGYNYYLNYNTDITAVELKINCKNEVMAGEEFICTLNYQNQSRVKILDGRIEAVFPESFVFSASEPAPAEKNNIWQIGDLEPKAFGQIEIKGKIFAPEGSTGIILVNLTYMPANFSSLFKKEASAIMRVKSLGLEVEFERFSNALVGEENEINLKYKKEGNSFLDNFRVTVAPADNLVFLERKKPAEADYDFIRPGVWQINSLTEEPKILPIGFKFIEKQSDIQPLVIIFEKQVNGRFYKFFEQQLEYEVMKNDLNLTLLVNGSREDSPIGFGDKLSYSIIYKNKGETEIKDVVIMAVLTSDFLDWASLEDKQNGRVSRGTISWTKNELPELAEIKKDEEGVIDFFIKTTGPGEINPSKEYEVKSYAQFTVGGREEAGSGLDNHSNTIINKFKSDFKFSGQVRYFSEDNIPVGLGPNPPQVGEKTVYKVYWQIANNLHELNEVVVRVKLPEYASFEDKGEAVVGSLIYNEDSREVIWRVGRLPVTVFGASANWNVGLTPSLADKNKILVILPEAKAVAFDTVSKADLEAVVRAKTTKLEDDEIGASDGIVR